MRLWRRSYDVPPPGGESLKDTVARVVPFYCQRILPPVMRGERVLVAAHGNSLRALVHGAGADDAGQHPDARARDRRADHLPAQRRFDGGVARRCWIPERGGGPCDAGNRARRLSLSAAYLDAAAQERLALEIAAIIASAPLFVSRMPKSGLPMSVRMTNCGPLGWMSDADKGYRYEPPIPKPARPGRRCRKCCSTSGRS